MLSIVLTGKMERNRYSEQKIYEKLGLKVKGSISKNIDYLVTGTEPGQVKISKAKDLNIPILTEAEFPKLLRELYPEYFL